LENQIGVNKVNEYTKVEAYFAKKAALVKNQNFLPQDLHPHQGSCRPVQSKTTHANHVGDDSWMRDLDLDLDGMTLMRMEILG